MVTTTRSALLGAVTAAALFAAGCGDGEVCGGYAGGNVAVVKPCRTHVAGDGQAITEPNELEPVE